MAPISFEQLYDDDKELSLGIFLLWANDFLDGFAIPGQAAVEVGTAFSFVANLRKGDFPANGGFEKASPFKKAANVYVWLHAIDPFKQTPPGNIYGEDLAQFSNATASLIGFALVKACLRDVVITRRDGTTVTLKNSIKLSRHFMCDLIEASSRITPESHFKIYSLLFEALAYEANPQACYPKVF